MKRNKFKQHKYRRLQYNLHDVEIAYQNGVKVFNSMSKEERVKKMVLEKMDIHTQEGSIFSFKNTLKKFVIL